MSSNSSEAMNLGPSALTKSNSIRKSRTFFTSGMLRPDLSEISSGVRAFTFICAKTLVTLPNRICNQTEFRYMDKGAEIHVLPVCLKHVL